MRTQKISTSRSLINHIEQVAISNNLELDLVVKLLEKSFTDVFLKEYSDNRIEVKVDHKKGKVDMWRYVTVVSDKYFFGKGLEDYETLIPLSEAKKLTDIKDPKFEDVIKKKISIDDFDKKLAKNIFFYFQKLIHEEVNKTIYKKWFQFKGKVLEGVVEKIIENKDQTPKEIFVSLIAPDKSSTQAVLYKFDLIQVDTQNGIKVFENLILGNTYLFYVKDVLENSVTCPILVTRTHADIVRYLMHKHISEIAENQIEIKAIARIAGIKTKVLVSSNNKNIDPVGCCIGPRGKRLKVISGELLNEKIDIILWTDDPVRNVIDSFVTGKIIGYKIEGEQELTLVVTFENLLSCIGKKGFNAKLVYMLTNWKTNLITIQEAKDKKIDYVSIDDKYVNTSEISERIYKMHYKKNEDLLYQFEERRSSYKLDKDGYREK